MLSPVATQTHTAPAPKPTIGRVKVSVVRHRHPPDNHKRVSVSEMGRQPRSARRVRRSRIEAAVSAEPSASHDADALQAALRALTTSAVANIPGVDFASVTMFGPGQALSTAAA